MKYTKTINMWEDGVQAKVLSGEIKMQAGQWLECGTGKKSRFVRCNGASIWAIHWQGNGGRANRAFRQAIASLNRGAAFAESR